MRSCGRPGTPASYTACSPAWRITRSTSARALLTTSSMRPGWMRPSAMSFVMARRATSRRTGSKPGQDDGLGRVVDDQVDAGGLLEGADVATLAADDAALHLVAGEVDDADRVLGGVVRGHALHRGDDDLAGLVVGLLAGASLDGAGELDGVVLGLLADGLEQDPLGVLGGQAGHLLQGGDALLVQAAELLALVLEVALAVVDLAALLLEHVRALVQLLVAREEAPLQVLQLRALGARLVLGLALQAQLLVLGLEDHVLLLRPGLGDDARGLVLGGLDALARQRAAGDEPHGGACHARDHHGHDGGDPLHLQFLPPGGMNAPGVSTRFGLGLRTAGIRLGSGTGGPATGSASSPPVARLARIAAIGSASG